jgi:cobalt-zinc-cadmium efflux system membrane fusion protein
MKNIELILGSKYRLGGLTLCLLALLSACGGVEKPKNQSDEVPSEDSDLIVVTLEQFNAAKMKIGQMSSENFSDIIKTTGRFDVPPSNKAAVSAYFGGYVKQLELLPGERAVKGQVLFTLENPAYIEIQQAFIEIQGNLANLKSDYERQKSLTADNVSSQKKYLQAEADYKSAIARHESLKMRLGLMNIDPTLVTAENMTSVISVKAPISGYITAVNASKGMFLNPSDIAITITNTDHLHIELNVFEKDLFKLKVDQEMRFRMQGDTRTFQASINLINKEVDLETRSVLVHCHLNDESEAENFIPGMFVEAEILTSTATQIALPDTAIAEIDNVHYVLLVKNQSNDSISLERREVKVGRNENGKTVILNHSDFPNGSQFLTMGTFNLILE